MHMHMIQLTVFIKLLQRNAIKLHFGFKLFRFSRPLCFGLGVTSGQHVCFSHFEPESIRFFLERDKAIGVLRTRRLLVCTNFVLCQRLHRCHVVKCLILTSTKLCKCQTCLGLDSSAALLFTDRTCVRIPSPSTQFYGYFQKNCCRRCIV